MPAMPQRIVILGGGVGGTIVANVVARALHADQAQITVIDATGEHQYMPGWLYLPFNHHEGLELSREERTLLNQHVQLVIGQVTQIDTVNREVTIGRSPKSGQIGGMGAASQVKCPYDYLVIGTGARLAPEDLSGLVEGAGKWRNPCPLRPGRRRRWPAAPGIPPHIPSPGW